MVANYPRQVFLLKDSTKIFHFVTHCLFIYCTHLFLDFVDWYCLVCLQTLSTFECLIFEIKIQLLLGVQILRQKKKNVWMFCRN
jgi:hypothetical protein